MRLTQTLLGGGEWGHLSHQSGIHTFGVSGFQQRAMKGYLTYGLAKGFKRYSRYAVFVLPSVAGYYYLQHWMAQKYEYYNRKEYKSLHEHEH